MKKIIILLLFIVSITTIKAQNNINFSSENLFPEGVVYDKTTNRFFISSLWKGQIGTIQKDGTYTLFYDNPKLISTLGMKIRNNHLYVCNTDFESSSKSSTVTKFKLAEVWEFDIRTKKLLHIYNLNSLFPGHRHMSNDLTIDDKGNVYVTDTMFPAIYKINNKGKVSVFVANNPYFNAQDTIFTKFSIENAGLNGIAYNKEGYLIAANYSKGLLLKINLKTKAISKVIIPLIFKAADGILFIGQNLYVSTNGSLNRVFKLNSADKYVHAKVIEVDSTGYTTPTTITAESPTKIFTVNAHLDKMAPMLTISQSKNMNFGTKDFSLKLYSANKK